VLVVLNPASVLQLLPMTPRLFSQLQKGSMIYCSDTATFGAQLRCYKYLTSFFVSILSHLVVAYLKLAILFQESPELVFTDLW